MVILSGTMADHGMAVMLARGDLMLEADIVSDTAPLHDLMERLLAAAPSTRWLRDATRGGVGTVCNELARDCNLTVVLDETALPVRPAGGGRLRAARDRPVVRGQRGQVRSCGGTRRSCGCARRAAGPRPGADAVRIGEIRTEPPGIVVLLTQLGGTRIVDMLVGDPLPRIC